MNEALAREELIALCKRLGHDPTKVSHVLVGPTTIEVVYVHPVSDG